MLDIIEFAKEKYEDLTNETVKESICSDVEHEVMVVKIDHMRKSGPYVRTLESWAQQLGLVGVLNISNDQGLVLLLEGDKCQITKFLLNWKTVNIDVDSRGKPCKERMIQILYRQKTDNPNQPCGNEPKDSFRVIECDNIVEFYTNKRHEQIIKSLFG